MRQLLCVLLLALPGMSWAAMFKCVNDGQIVYSTEPCGADAKMMLNTDKQATPREKMVLRMNESHAYTSHGTINGFPVALMVYPTAKKTAISQRTAENGGIHSCSGQDSTPKANWVVENCVVTLPEITFGEFHIKNLPVSVLPKMTVDALVGADVLHLFDVQEENGAMYISRK